jgi:hypothetical protein
VAVMTAACVSTNYMLIGVANVKFMDLIVFVSGMVFGPFAGASVGVLTWLVYGTLNPYGFSLPVLASTCTGESLYGVIGGLLGNRAGGNSLERAGGSPWFVNSKFAVAGFLLTFVYDLFTNIVSGLVAGIPMTVALISGIPFAMAHEISNMAFFFFGASPLVTAIGRLFPGGSC